MSLQELECGKIYLLCLSTSPIQYCIFLFGTLHLLYQRCEICVASQIGCIIYEHLGCEFQMNCFSESSCDDQHPD